jgi:CheY-like chemotaxis protein
MKPKSFLSQLSVILRNLANQLDKKTYKIVYLDDQPSQIILFESMILSGAEFQFKGFSSVKYAMPYIRSHACDLVLLDLQLGAGVADGKWQAYSLRETPSLRQVPIVVISQYIERWRVENRATAPGLLYYEDDGLLYMTKEQLTQFELITALRDILATHTTTDEPAIAA